MLRITRTRLERGATEYPTYGLTIYLVFKIGTTRDDEPKEDICPTLLMAK